MSYEQQTGGKQSREPKKARENNAQSRVQLKESLAGMSFPAQLDAIKPDMPVLFNAGADGRPSYEKQFQEPIGGQDAKSSSRTPVQAKTGNNRAAAVQKKDDKTAQKTVPTTADSADPEVKFHDISFSFQLAPNTYYAGRACTQGPDPTKVTLRVSRTDLKLTIDKPMRLRLPYPVSDVFWGGVRFGFKSGDINGVDVSRVPSSGFVDGVGVARGRIVAMVNQIFSCTRLRAGRYDPLKDKDLPGLFKKIKKNVDAMPKDTRDPRTIPKNPIDENRDEIVARLILPKGLKKQVGSYQVVISPNSIISAATPLSALTSLGKGKPTVPYIKIACDLNIMEKGKPLAWVGGVKLLHGGGLEVTDYRFTTPAKKKAQNWEIGLRFLLAFRSRRAMLSLHTRPQDTLKTEVVDTVAYNLLQKGLQDGFKNLVRQSRGKIPNVDLEKALGFK